MLEKFRALPATLQQVVAIEAFETIVGYAEDGEDGGLTKPTAAATLQLVLDRILYEEPDRLLLLTTDARAAIETFARELDDELDMPDA